MLNKNLIPFFPLKITGSENKWLIFDPLNEVKYELGFDGYCLLNACNGYSTWEEITASMSSTFGISVDEVSTRSESIIEFFTDKGLIWWRKERMQLWQVGPPAVRYLGFNLSM